MVTTLEALLVVHDDLEDRGWAPLRLGRCGKDQMGRELL